MTDFDDAIRGSDLIPSTPPEETPATSFDGGIRGQSIDGSDDVGPVDVDQLLRDAWAAGGFDQL